MKRIIFTLIFVVATLLNVMAQTYTLEDRWVSCGNGVQLLDPYYSNGVTFTWTGSSVGGKANGIGVAMKYVNGELESTYEGEYRKGVRAGKGKFTHKDGSVKTGTFIDGQLMGFGKMEAEDGSSYEGEFINYRMHGNGKARWGNGSTFEGYWVSDEPYTGKFVNYDGTALFIQAGAPVQKINERKIGYNPKIGSRLTEYFDQDWNRCDAKNAAFYRIITYSAPHTPKGVVKDYYMNGQLQGEATFVYIDYDDEGKNFNEGAMTTYYPNGKIKENGIYFNNKLNGPQVSYFENGKKQLEAMFYMGYPVGSTISYYENGNPNTVHTYENGELKNNKFLKFSETGEECYLIYSEDFNRNRELWEYEGANGSLKVNSDNSITMKITPDRSVSGGLSADFSPNNDLIVESYFHLDKSQRNIIYGIMFGFKDWNNYCGIVLSDGQFLYQQVRNGQKVSDHTWTYSDYIDSEVNKISIWSIGDKVAFQINGNDLGSIPRPRFDGQFVVLTAQNSGMMEATVDAAALAIYESVKSQEQIAEYLPSSQPSGDGWKGSGSGFFISENGYFATNYHVVDGANTIEATFIRDGNVENHPAIVVLSDKQNDLSILKIDSSSFSPMASIPYNFTTRVKDAGSEVFTLGYPMADIMGEEVKFTDGKISSKTGIQGDVTVYQISVPIQPGNSGGPLFDNQGNLVGITSSGLNRDYFKSENVNYAIKSSYLKSLIDALPHAISLQTNADIASKPLTEKIKAFQPYMIFLKVK